MSKELKITKDSGFVFMVVDPGGRGAQIVESLTASPLTKQVITSNVGTKLGNNPQKIALYKYHPDQVVDQTLEIAQKRGVDLVIIGPEGPLGEGIIDVLEESGTPAFGPRQHQTWLESNKAKAKTAKKAAGASVPEFYVPIDAEDAKDYAHRLNKAVVVKSAGLYGGKGCDEAYTLDQAYAEIDKRLLLKLHGNAGDAIVIEELLYGIEQSIQVIVDRNGNKIYLPTSLDYKNRDRNNPTKTGGMAAHSPSGNEDIYSQPKVEQKIINPTQQAVENLSGEAYRGVIYAGIMWVFDTSTGEWEPKDLETNIRFGDPEAEVTLAHYQEDAAQLFVAAYNGELNQIKPKWSDDCYVAVAAVSGHVPPGSTKGKGRFPGYPAKYMNGRVITGLENYDRSLGDILHSGTAWKCLDEEKHLEPCGSGRWETTGGRVLIYRGHGQTLEEARINAYKLSRQVTFDFKSQIDYAADAQYLAFLRNQAT